MLIAWIGKEGGGGATAAVFSVPALVELQDWVKNPHSITARLPLKRNTNPPDLLDGMVLN
jgi:hypothetical protein